MDKLVEEVRQWNTPSVGAYLLWEFTSGYCDSHPDGDAPVALLHFLAVPLLSSSSLLDSISNRRANLQSYIRGFEDSKNSDILIGIHDRAKRSRKYTMDAIDIAVATGLLFWDVESGKLYPRKGTTKASRGNKLKPSLTKLGNKAQILGAWFSEHNIHTIATYLKVVL